MPTLHSLIAISLSILVSFGSTFLLMPHLLRFCRRRGLYDMPDARKHHSSGIPRLGGVLFAPCAGIGICLSFSYLTWVNTETPPPMLQLSSVVLVMGMGLIYLIGFIDDLIGLRALFKLSIQFAATLFLPLCGLYINNLYGLFGIHELSPTLAYPLTIFVSLLIVNAFNLIDGIDGLSASLSILALAGFALIFFQLQVLLYSLIALALVGSIGAFFYYNVFGSVERNTKTFMGDTGTLVLGYILAFFAIKLAMNNQHVLPSNRTEALLTACTLIALPCFDLVRVASLRLLRGKGIFSPDRTHIHHKCLAAGFSQRQSLVLLLVLQSSFLGIAKLGFMLGLPPHYTLLAEVAAFSVFDGWLTLRSSRLLHNSASPTPPTPQS